MKALPTGFDFTEEDEFRTTGVHDIIPVSMHMAAGTVPGAERVVPAARLVCVTGGEIGRVFPLGSSPAVIGRASDAGVRLRIADISRRHARVGWRDGSYYVEDLGSANGTFINGVPIKSATAVRFGDRVQVGDSTIFVLGAHDELEARAAQLHKLEAMQHLVSGLARGFSDALMVISGGVEELEAGVTVEGDLREVMDDIKQAVASASDLAARLTDLQGTGPRAGEVVMVGAVVREAIDSLQPALPRNIAVAIDVDPRTRICGSHETVLDTLLEVITNARDAMPRGGTLAITAMPTAMDRAEALAHHLANEGEYVEITIIDTGVGMDAATLARAFEPFFTTKSDDPPAGLGLARVHGAVRHHGGSVVAASEVGHGTTIRIWLPAAT